MLGFAPLSTIPISALWEPDITVAASSGAVLEWVSPVQAQQVAPWESQTILLSVAQTAPVVVEWVARGVGSTGSPAEWRASLSAVRATGVQWSSPLSVTGAALLAWQQGVRRTAASAWETRGRIAQTGSPVLIWAGPIVFGGDVFGVPRSGAQVRGEVTSGSRVSGRSLSRSAWWGIWMSGV